ncbi:MAG: tRNA (guanosine(37)-N1)-methyltransferase TrmD, partial [Clostridia bacterium]|nr:tRNA (guanosine(37)-N1)-methyltransferase TrmD [Clostridia bacterium]
GGELAAAVLIDAVGRLVDGVLPDPICHEEESLSSGLLEYPQYTRPVEWHGVRVPEVLQNGNHQKIHEWRQQKAIELTVARRPDLLGDKGDR